MNPVPLYPSKRRRAEHRTRRIAVNSRRASWTQDGGRIEIAARIAGVVTLEEDLTTDVAAIVRTA